MRVRLIVAYLSDTEPSLAGHLVVYSESARPRVLVQCSGEPLAKTVVQQALGQLPSNIKMSSLEMMK